MMQSDLLGIGSNKMKEVVANWMLCLPFKLIR